jgi:hypothetical protein
MPINDAGDFRETVDTIADAFGSVGATCVVNGWDR